MSDDRPDNVFPLSDSSLANPPMDIPNSFIPLCDNGCELEGLKCLYLTEPDCEVCRVCREWSDALKKKGDIRKPYIKEVKISITSETGKTILPPTELIPTKINSPTIKLN